MTKTNNTIWYDWNSPSGFELLEIENQRANEQASFSKTTTISKVKQHSGSTCWCKSKSRVAIAI